MLIKRKFILNLLAAFAPAIVTIISIGVLARCMDSSEFGFYLVAMSITNYFLISDLGLSSSIIRYLGKNETCERKNSAVRYCIKTSGTVCLIVTMVAISLSGVFVRLTGVVSSENYVTSLSVLLLSIPAIVMLNLGATLIEASGDLALLVKSRTLQAILSGMIPAILAVIYDNSLIMVCLACTVGRYLSCTTVFARGLYKKISNAIPIEKSEKKELHGFGGWALVSNITNPLIVTLDKVLVSNSLGTSAAGTYGLATECMNKMLMVPQAAGRIIIQIGEEKLKLSNVTENISKYIAIFSLACAVLVYISAEKLVSLWVGSNSELVNLLRIFVFGFVMNSASQPLYNKLMAYGRSKEVAWLHLIELPIYFVSLYMVSSEYGLNGTGIVWASRMFVDNALLRMMVRKWAK